MHDFVPLLLKLTLVTLPTPWERNPGPPSTPRWGCIVPSPTSSLLVISQVPTLTDTPL